MRREARTTPRPFFFSLSRGRVGREVGEWVVAAVSGTKVAARSLAKLQSSPPHAGLVVLRPALSAWRASGRRLNPGRMDGRTDAAAAADPVVTRSPLRGSLNSDSGFGGSSVETVAGGHVSGPCLRPTRPLLFFFFRFLLLDRFQLVDRQAIS